jgi:hypothetical protein
MNAARHSRRVLIALAIVVAMVAIVVPTCRMVGCSMQMGDVRPFGHQTVAGFFSDCGGEYVMSGSPSAIVPSGSDSLTLSMLALLFAVLAFAATPRSVPRPVFAGSVPPRPPESPLGVRLTL